MRTARKKERTKSQSLRKVKKGRKNSRRNPSTMVPIKLNQVFICKVRSIIIE